MLRANLAGQILQTSQPVWKPLLPLFEAVTNAVQAVQDRGRDGGREIIVDVVAAPSLKLDDVERIELARGGKGVGRFHWLKPFAHVEVDSVVEGDEGRPSLRPRFTFDRGYDPDDVEVVSAPDGRLGTAIPLGGFLDPFRNQVTLDLEFIAQRMCEHFVLFLMRSDCPAIELRSSREPRSVNEVFEESFRRSSSRETLMVQGQEFEVHGFRLAQPCASRHRLVYCADHTAGSGSQAPESYLLHHANIF